MRHTYVIATDVAAHTIETPSADEAAVYYAGREGLPDITDLADLAEHVMRIGGTLRVLEDGVLLAQIT